EIWSRDHPCSLCIAVITRLREERAEKDTASARKQKPTMIQAPKSGSCRACGDVMDCLCQGQARAIILIAAGRHPCGKRRGWHAPDAALPLRRDHREGPVKENPVLLFARALDFAARKHVHQRRKGELAEPYVNHLSDVARLL